MTEEKKIVIATGRKKCARAKAIIREGIGRIRINKIPVELWQPEMARLKIMELITLTKDYINKVDIDIKVEGGGFMGQTVAAMMAMARGLIQYFNDPNLKEIIVSYDKMLLKGDPRFVEPKKFGGHGARARWQTSYR